MLRSYENVLMCLVDYYHSVISATGERDEFFWCLDRKAWNYHYLSQQLRHGDDPRRKQPYQLMYLFINLPCLSSPKHFTDPYLHPRCPHSKTSQDNIQVFRGEIAEGELLPVFSDGLQEIIYIYIHMCIYIYIYIFFFFLLSTRKPGY